MNIQQLEIQLADAEDKAQCLRQQLREHYLFKAAQYDSPRLQPSTPGNGKPPVNDKPKRWRKAKRIGASKAPSKPLNDICPQVRRTLGTELCALTPDAAHHAASIAKATGTADMPLLSRTLKWMIHDGQVATIGQKRGTQYHLTRKGVEAFNGDGFVADSESGSLPANNESDTDTDTETDEPDELDDI